MGIMGNGYASLSVGEESSVVRLYHTIKEAGLVKRWDGRARGH